MTRGKFQERINQIAAAVRKNGSLKVDDIIMMYIIDPSYAARIARTVAIINEDIEYIPDSRELIHIPRKTQKEAE